MGNDGRTIWETVIIFVLIGVAIVFITPIIQKIAFDSQLSTAKTSAEDLMKQLSVTYEEYSLSREVFLPFMLEFNENGTFDLYEQTTKVANNQLLEHGKKPDAGQVILVENGETIIKNLVYGQIICNKEANKQVECYREKQQK